MVIRSTWNLPTFMVGAVVVLVVVEVGGFKTGSCVDGCICICCASLKLPNPFRSSSSFWKFWTDALQLYLEVGEVENGEKLKVEQINKAINQMEDSHKQLKEDAPKRKEKVDAELAAQRAKDDARRQTQGVKRNKNGNKTNASGPQKKRAKTTKETAMADKKTMYMNKRIAKAFEGPSGQAEIYFGTVTKLASQNPLYWHIHYDDDDEEEFDEKDLGRALRLYQANRNDDPRYNGGNSNNDSSLVDGLAEAGAASEATDNKE